MATLHIVATPIGNLKDMTPRGLEVLQKADVVACEDTRVTAKLLQCFGITGKRTIAYHQRSGDAVVGRIADMLNEGLNLALVSDAGTPGINDPGGRLIGDLVARIPSLVVTPIPGPNAAIAALSVCGFPADRYAYWGFVPHKKGRETFFRELAVHPDTVVFYEGKYRIGKTLTQMTAAFNAAGIPARPVMVARELTKKFETLYRGTAASVAEALAADEALGEFVVVVAPRAFRAAGTLE